MDERESVDMLFMETLEHPASGPADRTSYQDEISFQHPVQIELVRIPHHGRDLYKRMVSQTQKQTIKSLEVYYRNLDKASTRYSLLNRSNSELLVSSTSDILLTLRETIYTDLLVIRGNFTTITLCIYGRVLPDSSFPYFHKDVEAPLDARPPTSVVNEDIWQHSMQPVEQLQRQAATLVDREDRAARLAKLEARDSVFHEQQIKNICQLSSDLLGFIGMHTIEESVLAEVRTKMEELNGNISKLFKSAHLGLYYPPSYLKSSIPLLIPLSLVPTTLKLLSLNLSDQYRALQVLKLILQLLPHAENFYQIGGCSALVKLFIQFFNSDQVILSSLKSLLLEAFITLSFWKFSAEFFVSEIRSILVEPEPEVPSSENAADEKSEESDRERSREKKKKKDRSESQKSRRKKKSDSEERGKKGKKKEKKDKKDKKKEKEKKKERESKSKAKESKVEEKVKEAVTTKIDLSGCSNFYEVLLQIIRAEKNCKLIHLLRILIQQITQTLTKNPELSISMATHTPLMRDVKYMFSQGGEIIGSKPLKMFVSFHPFLNDEQSRGVQCALASESEKIVNCLGGLNPELFELINKANSVLMSRSEALYRSQGENSIRMNDEDLFSFDSSFIALMSTLIEKNEKGVPIGLSNFIDALKLESLLSLKKHEAAIAIICEYIHEVLLEDEGTNLMLHMDQIHASMVKISGWLKEDRTFSRQIKRKVQYLINAVLSYNSFSGPENAFKSFADYFVKLIGHQNFEINNIIEYVAKEYDRSVNHGSFANLSENFGLGNFFEVLPAQPLLEIDICLKIFLILLKFNRNIWTMFYDHKLVTAFASLYIKLHSLVIFFLTPSLERQNVLVNLRKYEPTILNYLQVTKRITDLFVEKTKYESAFNELADEQDIFDHVEMFEKSIDIYLVLFNAEGSPDLMISSPKTISKMKEVMANISAIFSYVMKSYEYTRHSSRESKIRSILEYLFRQHYKAVIHRPSVLSLFRVLICISGNNTLEILKNFLLGPNPANPKDQRDLLLPSNDKSPFENLLLQNVYRSDRRLLAQLSGLIEEMMSKPTMKEQVCSLLENMVNEHESKLKDHLQEKIQGLLFYKYEMVVRLLGTVNCPKTMKMHELMLRLFKSTTALKYFHDSSSDEFETRKLQLRNAFCQYFQSLFANEKELPFFSQVLRALPPLLLLRHSSDKEQIRCLQLRGCLDALKIIISAADQSYYQSVLLYGDFLDYPSRPTCEASLSPILSALVKPDFWEGLGEPQTELCQQITLSAFYILCQLTSQGHNWNYFSTESRKNALNYLVSPEGEHTLQDVTAALQTKLPAEFVDRIQGFMAEPVIEQAQSLGRDDKKTEVEESRGSAFSRTVFTMISENDAIGKTRFEFIDEKWIGGDVSGKLYHVNAREDFLRIMDNVIQRPYPQAFMHEWANYVGVHQPRTVNPLFTFKIKKLFTPEVKKAANTNIVIKTIPDVVLKPEEPVREPPKPQAMMKPMPAYTNNNPVTGGHMGHMNNQRSHGQSPAAGRSTSNNRDRDHSPYASTNNTNRHSSTGYTPPPVQNSHYGGNSAYVPPQVQPPQPQNTHYDNRGYDYTRGSYDQRAGYYPPPVAQPSFDSHYPQRGYSNPPVHGYQPPGFPSAHGYAPVPSDEELAGEAINLLLYLRSHAGSIEPFEKERIMGRVNSLVKNPSIKARVERYFGR